MSINMKNIFRNICFLSGAVAFLLMGNTAFADTPDSLKGATLVDAVKAKSLFDAGVKMIDARVANEYAESHIKGAINVPYKEKSAKAVDFDVKQDSTDLSLSLIHISEPTRLGMISY